MATHVVVYSKCLLLRTFKMAGLYSASHLCCTTEYSLDRCPPDYYLELAYYSKQWGPHETVMSVNVGYKVHHNEPSYGKESTCSSCRPNTWPWRAEGINIVKRFSLCSQPSQTEPFVQIHQTVLSCVMTPWAYVFTKERKLTGLGEINADYYCWLIYGAENVTENRKNTNRKSS